MQNWDKYLTIVQDKKERVRRYAKNALGNRSELDKEELRRIFPTVQRLFWTKWGSRELFENCFTRFFPLSRLFQNRACPTKLNR